MGTAIFNLLVGAATLGAAFMGYGFPGLGQTGLYAIGGVIVAIGLYQLVKARR
ncbi:MAG: hypothetical protein JRI23_33945 [Deltaproteobacteria bacterium]|jgi:lipopolysaccharide export LptBFGC system permease protein LptF|nr:hypothetical protein [Deltaproteobacteria bacterium]MBW2537295.1 hypothetical protein [Deltaproteobacteria bacterium]